MNEPATSRSILAVSTLGSGSNEEMRIRDLLETFRPNVFPFDRTRKFKSFCRLVGTIRRDRPDLVVMEGTGIAGGFALLLCRLLFGRRYVVSSGDAVGPWVGGHFRLLGPPFGFYERLLCRWSAGFIGWTPYLAGRALTFGSPRAMTAAGWAPFRRTLDDQAADRRAMRTRLGIPEGNVVVGIAGSMVWTGRYCYGLELVEAARRVTRPDATFLLVGDGNGRDKLLDRAKDLPPGRVVFTGRVPQNELPAYYAAMDVGSLPQTVDKIGSFRYTTKVSEYLAFGLPLMTGQLPLAYDLDDGWIWRLPGDQPWSDEYVSALAKTIDALSPTELQARRDAVPRDHEIFDRRRQIERATRFVGDILAHRGVG